MSTEVEDFLEHFGVKGMHWGVRKQRTKSSTSSEDHAKTSDIRKKKLHELSNVELKTLNERLNLEQNFKRLNPPAHVKGKKAVAGVLGTAGLGVTAFNLLKSPAGQIVVSGGKRFLSSAGLLVKGLKFVN